MKLDVSTEVLDGPHAIGADATLVDVTFSLAFLTLLLFQSDGLVLVVEAFEIHWRSAGEFMVQPGRIDLLPIHPVQVPRCSAAGDRVVVD
ncbi:hypothetical protein AXK57_04770 [Tsukamurella pulmonis]|nr:hypothetical protein AXK57_04770 [Tsukamurella pulmonis]RDH12784.1 hypothetical protein DVB88_05435 [Tsukamurella pulmonis]